MLKKASGVAAEHAEITAFLGKGTAFKGILNFEGTIRVDGKVEGEIISKDTLIAGDDAELKGEVGIGTLISSGKIEGNIVATQKVQLLSPGTVNGNITTPVLIIEEGVQFDGNCVMKAEKKEQKVVSLTERQ